MPQYPTFLHAVHRNDHFFWHKELQHGSDIFIDMNILAAWIGAS